MGLRIPSASIRLPARSNAPPLADDVVLHLMHEQQGMLWIEDFRVGVRDLALPVVDARVAPDLLHLLRVLDDGGIAQELHCVFPPPGIGGCDGVLYKPPGSSPSPRPSAPWA